MIDVPTSSPTLAADTGQDLHCPLCDYNLRGLSEPRCPECGHIFDWQQLKDAYARRHPYLFEHHPRRNLASFLKTLFASLLPRRLWRNLSPVHTPVSSRLIAYWMAVLLIAAAIGFATGLAAPGVSRYTSALSQQLYQRQQLREDIRHSGYLQRLVAQDWESAEVFIANRLPLPVLSWTFIARGFGDVPHWQRNLLLPSLLAVALWPWLTVAALLLFRASLRQARIRSAHVVRCAIYSADAGVFLGPILLVAAATVAWQLYRPASWWTAWIFMFEVQRVTLLGILLMQILFTYRLSCAYRLYLRFPQAVATVAASQVIVLLILLKLLFIWHGH